MPSFGSIKKSSKKEEGKESDTTSLVHSSIPASRRTPAKKLFKKLFCASSGIKSKISVVSSTSLENPSDSVSNPSTINPTVGQHDPAHTVPIANSNQSPLTIPSLASSTFGFDDDDCNDSFFPSLLEDNTMKSSENNPTNIPLPESPLAAGKEKVPRALLEHQSPPDETVLFSDWPSSNSDATPLSQRRAPSTPNQSLQSHIPMKTPGLAIPTPQANPLADQPNTTMKEPFPHPLKTVSESPLVARQLAQVASLEEEDEDAFLPDDFGKHSPMDLGTAPGAKTYTSEEVAEMIQKAEDDLRAHLQDQHQHIMEEFEEEVEKQLQEHGAHWKKDAEAEYKRLDDLLQEEKAKTQQKHHDLLNKTTTMDEFQAEMDELRTARQDDESRIRELEAQLRESESKAENERARELYRNQMEQQIKGLQEELSSLHTNEANRPGTDDYRKLQTEKEASDRQVVEMQERILALEDQLKGVSSSGIEDLRELQQSKEEVNVQVLELETQLEDLRQQVNSSTVEEVIVLKSEKAKAERQIQDLQQQLKFKMENSGEAQAQLKAAEMEISTLDAELQEMRRERLDNSHLTDVSHEDLFAARAEVDTLRVLRAEEEKERDDQIAALKSERDALQDRIDELEKKYQAEFNSPRKKGRESTVSIHAMTMEVFSPEKAAAEEQSRAESIDKLKAERDELRVQLEQQQAKSKEVDELTKQVTAELDQKIQSLQRKLKKQDQDFETEKRSLQAGMSVAEIEELTTQVNNLKKEHAEELGVRAKAASEQLERVQADAKAMRDELEANFIEVKARLLESHAKEMQAVHTEIKELRLKHQQELKLVQSKSKENADVVVNQIKSQLTRLKVEFEDEKIEIIETSAKEHDELQERLMKQSQNYEEQLRAARKRAFDFEQKVERLREEVASTSANIVTQQYLNELQAKFAEDLEDVKAESEKEKDRLRTRLDLLGEDKLKLTKKVNLLERNFAQLEKKHSSELAAAKMETKQGLELELKALEETIKSMEMGDGELTQKVAQLQARIETDLNQYNRRIRDVRVEHSKEIEELLTQLDLVEAEHNERFQQKESLLKEKDVVISALGSQLAEAEKQLETINDNRGRLISEVHALTRQLESTEAELVASKNEISKIVADHKHALEEEELLRETACEEARNDIIQTADMKWGRINDTYKNLKNQFDQANSRIAELEGDLRKAEKAAAVAKEQYEKKEMDLNDELAHAKAAVATGDLNATRKVRQIRGDLDKAKASEKNLQEKLDEALSTSRSVQKTLAAILAEKERLVAENRALQEVCTDAMAIVESNQQGSVPGR